ncbi:hypothetical protein PLESTB_001731700 [Pleodorina starrii]|uniref:PDZ domain-containing protein n=1 Tax=Pleodorina starrii TaxID=330485 RepID=A0A9W6F9F4_9CHLO|nr:hypothetical protein PLESTM_000734200 [Pleodorina starrii]GLC61213.1 hypothetical protein PLESTB_001731700 [Pleodorina starrii]GLC76875.1 hypothetical protein PLESTF_001850500 [Pleodorina starrii]
MNLFRGIAAAAGLPAVALTPSRGAAEPPSSSARSSPSVCTRSETEAAAAAPHSSRGDAAAADATASTSGPAPAPLSPSPAGAQPPASLTSLRCRTYGGGVMPLADLSASAAFASVGEGGGPAYGLRTRGGGAASAPSSSSFSSSSLECSPPVASSSVPPAAAAPALASASAAQSQSQSPGLGPSAAGSSSSSSSSHVGSQGDVSGVSSSSGGQAAGAAGAGAGSGPGSVGVDPETAALAAGLGLGVGEVGVVRLFERHRASVVNISGMRAMQTFTTLDPGKMPYGQGSGFLWGDKGHVVTCYHLVKGAAEVKVTLYDNTSYTAKVLGYDAAKNVAVLKLSVPKSKLRELQPVTPGSAAGLRVGQNVYGIGNPWGLGHTLSQGLVCGLDSELGGGLFPIKGLILSSCQPDPGSSGGVMLDSKGQLVGMLVTPPASSGGGGWGGGGGGRSFAVPLDAIRGLIAQILAYGRTVRPALGITMAPAQVLERVGLEGVLVLEVPPGSPAAAAGLRPTHRDIFGDLVLGDVIVGLDGKPVRSSSDVYDILDEHRVGDRVKLDVVRDGKQTGLTVTLGERLLGAVEE